MRRLLPLLALLPTALVAQAPVDTALVHRILVAEERRDSTDAALAAGRASGDARVRLLAARALGRLRDPKFVLRDSLPAAAGPSVAWPEPLWKSRLREIGEATPCVRLAVLLNDPVWPVRQRALARAGRPCTDAVVRGAVIALADRPTRTRSADGTSWHDAAYALETLARLDAAAARPRVLAAFSAEPWQLRRAAVRATATLGDTTRVLRALTDRDGNVQEAAVEVLVRLSPRTHDAALLSVVASSPFPQAVRAAAEALTGSSLAQIPSVAATAYATRWRTTHDSQRDVRTALRALAPTAALPEPAPAVPAVLPREAAALALGAERRIRVELEGNRVFTVRVRGDIAPIMAARLLARVRARQYDGTTWHRVEHDFVIQGGSRGANEYVGDAVYLKDELGTLAHPRGTVGMSTRGHDTGDAQWFVNLRDNARLRDDYTVWAEVVEGMDVVDGVVEGDRIVRMLVLPLR